MQIFDFCGIVMDRGGAASVRCVGANRAMNEFVLFTPSTFVSNTSLFFSLSPPADWCFFFAGLTSPNGMRPIW